MENETGQNLSKVRIVNSEIISEPLGKGRRVLKKKKIKKFSFVLESVASIIWLIPMALLPFCVVPRGVATAVSRSTLTSRLTVLVSFSGCQFSPWSQLPSCHSGEKEVGQTELCSFGSKNHESMLYLHTHHGTSWVIRDKPPAVRSSCSIHQKKAENQNLYSYQAF